MSDLKKMYSTLVQDPFPDDLVLMFGKEELRYKKRQWEIDGEQRGLRYGENPDQPAALYQLVEGTLQIGEGVWRRPADGAISALSEGQMLQVGKHPGKTNLTDVDNGLNILQYLVDEPACVILKHNNPCGAAWSDNGIASAFNAAFWCDRVAAFGGAVVVNSPMTLECAEEIAARYFEIVAAPSFESGSFAALASRKNLRIIELPALADLSSYAQARWLDIKSLSDGGLIVQQSFHNRILADADFIPAQASGPDGLEVVARFPDKAELADLRFAWAVEAGVSSNSVIFAKNGATVAIGTGEQDRVGCVEIAIFKAYNRHSDAIAWRELGISLYELKRKARQDQTLAEKLQDIEERTAQACGGLAGSRLVSDGFFPFRDGVDAALEQKVTAIAQPGGSLRDWEAIMACNEAVPQAAMVFTGQRSFRH